MWKTTTWRTMMSGRDVEASTSRQTYDGLSDLPPRIRLTFCASHPTFKLHSVKEITSMDSQSSIKLQCWDQCVILRATEPSSVSSRAYLIQNSHVICQNKHFVGFRHTTNTITAHYHAMHTRHNLLPFVIPHKKSNLAAPLPLTHQCAHRRLRITPHASSSNSKFGRNRARHGRLHDPYCWYSPITQRQSNTAELNVDRSGLLAVHFHLAKSRKM